PLSFHRDGAPRALPSFPTRRSSDLALLGRFLFSGEDAEKPLEGLSGGERRRLSLAILVQSAANVLVLDEPTNHLDIGSREALEEDRKSTRLNSSHVKISYAVFCLKK